MTKEKKRFQFPISLFVCYLITLLGSVTSKYWLFYLTCSIEIDVLSAESTANSLQPAESWEFSSLWTLIAPFNLSTSRLIEFNCSFSNEIIVVVAVVGVRDEGDENVWGSIEIWTLLRWSCDNVGGKSLSTLVSMNLRSSSLVFDSNFRGRCAFELRLFLDRIEGLSVMLSLFASVWTGTRLFVSIPPFVSLLLGTGISFLTTTVAWLNLTEPFAFGWISWVFIAVLRTM